MSEIVKQFSLFRSLKLSNKYKKSFAHRLSLSCVNLIISISGVEGGGGQFRMFFS